METTQVKIPATIATVRKIKSRKNEREYTIIAGVTTGGVFEQIADIKYYDPLLEQNLPKEFELVFEPSSRDGKLDFKLVDIA